MSRSADGNHAASWSLGTQERRKAAAGASRRLAQSRGAQTGSSAPPGRLYGRISQESERAAETADGPAGPVELIARVARRTFTPLARDGAETPSRIIQWGVTYVSRHFGEDIKLDDVARAAGLSKFHFLRRFRKEAGMTPGAFLQRYRIMQAMERLVGSDCRITEIARAVGYASPASFSRAFLKITGTPPYLYRHTRIRKRSVVSDQPSADDTAGVQC